MAKHLAPLSPEGSLQNRFPAPTALPSIPLPSPSHLMMPTSQQQLLDNLAEIYERNDNGYPREDNGDKDKENGVKRNNSSSYEHQPMEKKVSFKADDDENADSYDPPPLNLVAPHEISQHSHINNTCKFHAPKNNSKNNNGVEAPSDSPAGIWKNLRHSHDPTSPSLNEVMKTFSLAPFTLEELVNIDCQDFLLPKVLVDRMRRKFDLIDTDGSGAIGTSEVHTLLEDMGLNPAPDEVAALIARVDLDNSGEIDFSEFVFMYVMQMIGTNEKEDDMWEAFDVLDSTMAGKITFLDLKQNLDVLLGEKLPDEEIRLMIEWADRSKADGVLWNDFPKIIHGET